MPKVPVSPCPHCASPNDAAANLDDDAMPEPGDVSVCAYCSTKLVFQDDLTVRRLTPTDFKALPLETQEYLMRLGFELARRRNQLALNLEGA